MKILLKLTLALALASPAILWANEDPRAVFDRYVQLGGEFDPAVAELYADQALVHAYRVYPHGLERNMALTGIQWKQLLAQVMPLARAQNDKSTFSDIEITNIPGGYRIKADRYSVRKCYTDTGYYMVLKPVTGGGLKIFEEYLETRPQSNC